MGLFKSLFGPDKEQVINNNKEVYDKFLKNLAENPEHEYLRQLTMEAGNAYYASLRKNGELTDEDKETVLSDIEKAIQSHKENKDNQSTIDELRRQYSEYIKKMEDEK